MEKAGLSFYKRKKTTEGHRYCTVYRHQISTTDLFTGTGTCTVQYRVPVLSRCSTSTELYR